MKAVSRTWVFVLLAVAAGAQTQPNAGSPPTAEEQAAPPPAPPEPPFWKRIDWSDRSNQLMLALGVGAVFLTKVVLRKLQE